MTIGRGLTRLNLSGAGVFGVHLRWIRQGY